MRKHYLIIAAVWIVATALNLNKAFHIDDTFHLEAAIWLKDHPTTPMSGTINWDDQPTPMHNHNQPPLFFFLLAQVVKVTGTGEILLHLFMAVFSLLSLIVFYRLLKLLQIKHTTVLLLLFALNPAFLVNQNLMTDIPLLLVLLLFAYFLLKAGLPQGRTSDYYTAASMLGIGLLIKYSLLPLLVVLPLVMLLRKHYRALPALLIPGGLLTLWGLWNLHEFGTLHFSGRSGIEIHINRLWSLLACLGAIAVFAPLIVPRSSGARWQKYIALSGIVITFITALAVAARFMNESMGSLLLNYSFILTGIYIVYILFRQLFAGIREHTLSRYISTPQATIALMISALAAFTLLFAPFNATRHLLLILPFILIFCAGLTEQAPLSWKRAVVVYTAFAGLLLGISDYLFADYYRRMISFSIARTTAHITDTEHTDNTISTLNTARTIYTTGHWGWQWYATKAGYRQYSITDTTILAGDIFISPAKIPSQTINTGIILHKTDSIVLRPSPFSFVYTADAGWYSNTMETPPFIFSHKPIDTLFFYTVKATPTE